MKRSFLKTVRRLSLDVVRTTFMTAAIGCLAAMMATFTGCTKDDTGIDGNSSIDGSWTGEYSGIDVSLQINESAGTYLLSVDGLSEFGTYDSKKGTMTSTDEDSFYTLKYNKKDDSLTLTDEDDITIIFYRVSGKKTDEPEVKAEMQNVTFRGVVKDVKGKLLSGVKVSTGDAAATTNNEGVFTLTKVGVVGNRAVLKFAKDGYFAITRSGVKENEMNMEVVMQQTGNSDNTSQATFSAGSAKTLTAGNMKVSVPASSLVKADGSAYTGTAKADMFYLDPNNENLPQLMPGGDLAAVRSDNSAVQLITYGMTEVSLTDANGSPLQLKKGAEAEMTFPVPKGKDQNPPATIPLWSFDEDRGIWVEEGVATLKGNVYVGKVSHFSWHNIDSWEGVVIIKGKVTDCNNQPVKYVLVTVDETASMTGSTGEYSVRVPANTPVTVTVKSSDYDNYSPVVAHNVPGQAAGTTYTRNISLPCRNSVNPDQPSATIKGKVTDCNNQPVKNVMVTVGQTSVATNTNGEYSVQVPANQSVTVTVKKEDYGDYSPIVSHNVPGQPANSTYTRNISLPCLTTTDPDIPEGSFFGTKCARIKYLLPINGMSLYMTLTFDDYGKRQRIETERDGVLSIVILDHITKKYYVCTDGEWIDMTQYMPWEQLDFSASSQFSADQQNSGYEMTVSGTETIAGRSCTVYTIKRVYTDPDTGVVCDIRSAVWRGVSMMTEACGQVIMIAQEASLEIPANSFNPR